MDKKVLVTGASGLIGRELCKQLSIDNYVVAIDNGFRYDHIPHCDEFINKNIAAFLATEQSNYDYVFHMGNINGTKYFYDIPNELIQTNIETDFAIFNFVEQNPNCKLIYASSSEIVAGTDVFPTPEQTDVTIKNIHNPRWSYRLGKIVGENYLVNSSIDYLIIRFFNIFGPSSGSGHFVRDILDKIAQEDYTLIGAHETRSFCRVEDAVDAITSIYKNALNDIVNIGSNEEITVLDAAEIISEHKGIKIEWNYLPGNSGSVARRKPDISQLLKYYPSFSPRKFKDAVKDL